MSKLFIGFLLTILLTIPAVAVLAKSDNANSGNGSSNQGSSNSQNKDDNSGRGSQNSNGKQEDKNDDQTEVEDDDDDDNDKVESSGKNNRQASPTCAPEAEWKNHGDFVSCVAKLRQGGKAVSEAAKSDIGKKNASPSASLSPVPSASTSASPSATPNISPDPDSTESASLTEAIANSEVVLQIEAIGSLIGDFFRNLKNLFSL